MSSSSSPSSQTPTTKSSSSSYTDAMKRSNQDELEWQQPRQRQTMQSQRRQGPPPYQQQQQQQRQQSGPVTARHHGRHSQSSSRSQNHHHDQQRFRHPPPHHQQQHPSNHYRGDIRRNNNNSSNNNNNNNGRPLNPRQQSSLPAGSAWGGRRNYNEEQTSFPRPPPQHHQQQQPQNHPRQGGSPPPQQQRPPSTMAWGRGGAGGGGPMLKHSPPPSQPSSSSATATAKTSSTTMPYSKAQQAQQSTSGSSGANTKPQPQQKQQTGPSPQKSGNNQTNNNTSNSNNNNTKTTTTMTTVSKKKPSAKKKRNKTKPTLQTMCIGDMISLPTTTTTTTTIIKKEEQKHQVTSPPFPLSSTMKSERSAGNIGLLDRPNEFPALGATTTTTTTATTHSAVSPDNLTSNHQLSSSQGQQQPKKPAWGILVTPTTATPKATTLKAPPPPPPPPPSMTTTTSNSTSKSQSLVKKMLPPGTTTTTASNPLKTPIRVLKRGEPAPVKKGKNGGSPATTAPGAVTGGSGGNSLKRIMGKTVTSKNAAAAAAGNDAAVFRWGDGDEHQLMRLMMMKQQGGDGNGPGGRRKDGTGGTTGTTIHGNNIFVLQKGRQRLTPRKKRFTALKKKVLMERLKRWSELHPTPDDKEKDEESKAEEHHGGVMAVVDESSTPKTTTNVTTTTTTTPTKIVCIFRFVTDMDELQDYDEYQEIVTNLEEFAVKIGPVDNVFIPCPSSTLPPKEEEIAVQQSLMKQEDEGATTTTSTTTATDRERVETLLFGNKDEDDDTKNNKNNIPVFVKFQSIADAAAAQACWNGLILGGEPLEAFCIPDTDHPPEEASNQEGQSSNPNWSFTIVEAALTARKARIQGLDISGSPVKEPSPTSTAKTLVLENVLTEDDLEDEDCLAESLQDISKLVEKYGIVCDVKVSTPTTGSNDTHDGTTATTSSGSSRDVEVSFEGLEMESAHRIVEQLRHEMLGGTPILAHVLDAEVQDENKATGNIVVLKNALTDDDLEDEDCLEETLKDIRELASRHGQILDVSADANARVVEIQYAENQDTTRVAAQSLDGLCLSGITLVAEMKDGKYKSNTPGSANKEGEEICLVYLHNLLTEDDMEDEECLEESLNDARELATQFGEVLSVDVVRGDASAEADGQVGVIAVKYKGPPMVGESAANGFNGMVIGGQILSAVSQPWPGRDNVANDVLTSSLPNSEKRESPTKDPEGSKASVSKKARTDDLQPLYSGDKLISERFAECKRVPKIPNSGAPRDYANLAHDERVKPLLVEMLGELMRLQKRAIEDKNAKARRRLVMGLREVARGIRAHKVKMVVMANNLDEYGAIDQKLQEIIDLANSEAVPLFFEFTKRSLGKAIGKSIKVAVVGIQNADGAHQPFKKLTSIANTM